MLLVLLLKLMIVVWELSIMRELPYSKRIQYGKENISISDGQPLGRDASCKT